MENENLILATTKRQRLDFYIWFFILLFSGVIVFMVKLPFPKLEATLAIGLQQVLILSMLGGIPGVLYWAKNKMQDLAEISAIDKRLKRYSTYVLIRQSVFFILGFFALILQVITIMNGALILFLVVIGLCAFIAPSRSRLETEAFLVEPEPKDESEPASEDESEPASEDESEPKSES